jgi:YVTN family beta-propeller protein
MRFYLPSSLAGLAGAAVVANTAFTSTVIAKEPVRRAPPVEKVGRVAAGRYITPTNQVLTPAGLQVALPGLRPQAIALSPDGRLLAVSGKTKDLILIDPLTAQIRQKITIPGSATAAAPTTPNPAPGAGPGAGTTTPAATTEKEPATQLSFTGLVFSRDGTRLYLSNVGGNIKAFAVGKDRVVTPAGTIAVPDARTSKRKQEIPAGLAVSDDGKRLYVAGNLSNKLHEIDLDTGKTIHSWETGVAPFAVVLAAGKAYVSNSGGRRPQKGDLAAPAGRGTTVRVDPVRHIANEGSVTVIDLTTRAVKAELPVELHASALAVSPDQRHVVVANTGSDTLSVIDTRSDQVVEKIWTRQTPADLFGAQPNALTFDRSGKQLFACNGTQNAVAVIRFDPADNESKVTGLIPVGWFPGAIEFDPARRALYVANIKGIGAMKVLKPGDKAKFGTKDFYGTVSLMAVPNEKELPRLTALALQNMRYPKLAEAALPARPDQPARPVPERVGEPSVFKHVIYVIKENRTYDQILGDVKEGNGDASLCTFGEKYTPNQHKIAREFVLLDNTYCSGVQSADGHQWTDSAIANSYTERQVTSGFPRSYTGGKADDGLDALAWASSGFIWDNVLAHKKTFRNYGEWMLTELAWKDPAKKDKPKWQDVWDDYKNGTGLIRLASKPGIESLRKHSKLDTVGWDLNVPDVIRAAAFIKELQQLAEEGQFPDLAILFLPNDHTGGTRGKGPTPGAQIADNDLAFGQIVEALTRSKIWPQTCLIAIEDDPQAGWDHVSGYRTTCYVVSPYTKRRETISEQYNQTSVMRTIELILGLPPMNQLDAVATPMSACFNDAPDLTPFISVPNRVPLDQINPEPKKITDRILRQDAIASAKLPLDEMDQCPEDLFNRILWRAMKGTRVPYPEWAVKADEDDD